MCFLSSKLFSLLCCINILVALLYRIASGHKSSTVGAATGSKSFTTGVATGRKSFTPDVILGANHLQLV